MALPGLEDDCDECVPDYMRASQSLNTKAAFSTLPFITTFAIVTLLAYKKVFPLLSSSTATHDKANKGLPRPATSQNESSSQTIARRVAAITFSSTIAFSVVLTELLLCEISNSLNRQARSVALQVTVAGLLGLLVVAIPLLGIYSAVSKSGYNIRNRHRSKRRLAWLLEVAGYSVFLFGFWMIGAFLPETKSINDTILAKQNLFQACLDRLGLTGVSLMALLSGFASISAIWQNFGPKHRTVSEADITRKQAGLDATMDMIAEKKERIRHLDRVLGDKPARNFWSRTVGSIRGSPETQEKQVLTMEVDGLNTMISSLESSLNILRTRRTTQMQSNTTLGRLSLLFSYTFSCYCIYRIATTTINIVRRMFSLTMSTGSETDPITYAISIFARHFYPSLDQASWAQQISFLISGIMLLASFSAVTQTFHLFARFMPSVLHATKSNFALLLSQISGMYVISSALMLRGMMPKEVGSVINSALGAGALDPPWVQKWFDGFFMVAVILTALGIFLGRQFSRSGVWDDDDSGWSGGLEMGKRS